jgi:hypothetical protein
MERPSQQTLTRQHHGPALRHPDSASCPTARKRLLRQFHGPRAETCKVSLFWEPHPRQTIPTTLLDHLGTSEDSFQASTLSLANPPTNFKPLSAVPALRPLPHPGNIRYARFSPYPLLGFSLCEAPLRVPASLGKPGPAPPGLRYTPPTHPSHGPPALPLPWTSPDMVTYPCPGSPR